MANTKDSLGPVRSAMAESSVVPIIPIVPGTMERWKALGALNMVFVTVATERRLFNGRTSLPVAHGSSE